MGLAWWRQGFLAILGLTRVSFGLDDSLNGDVTVTRLISLNVFSFGSSVGRGDWSVRSSVLFKLLSFVSRRLEGPSEGAILCLH